MNDQDRAASPWGEPASPTGASYRSLATGPPGPLATGPPGPPAGGRTAPLATRGGPGDASRGRKPDKRSNAAKGAKPTKPSRRNPVMVERTILVRLIPRTGVFARLRAAVALAVIAVIIGFGIAATLSVVVWGVATAIHHAAGN